MSPIIRLATPHDADQILAIYAPIVEHTAISFELEVPTLAEITQRISNTLARYPWLSCEEAGQVLGYAYASAHRTRAAYQWSVDVSAYVHPTARRRGVGQALYTSFVQILGEQGFYNAYAGIALPNPASVRLHESVGFRSVGVYQQVGYKLGAWHDVGWWQLALQTRDNSVPAPPLDLPTLQATNPNFERALQAGQPCLRF